MGLKKKKKKSPYTGTDEEGLNRPVSAQGQVGDGKSSEHWSSAARSAGVHPPSGSRVGGGNRGGVEACAACKSLLPPAGSSYLLWQDK